MSFSPDGILKSDRKAHSKRVARINISDTMSNENLKCCPEIHENKALVATKLSLSDPSISKRKGQQVKKSTTHQIVIQNDQRLGVTLRSPRVSHPTPVNRTTGAPKCSGAALEFFTLSDFAANRYRRSFSRLNWVLPI